MVFAEMLTEDEILDGVKDSEKVAIVACYACANGAIAVASEDGITREYDEATGETIPMAVVGEMRHLQDLLQQYGKKVTTHLMRRGTTPCALLRESLQYLTNDKDIMAADTVLALACEAGVIGLRNLFPNHRVAPTFKIPSSALFSERETINNGRTQRIIPSTAKQFRFSR